MFVRDAGPAAGGVPADHSPGPRPLKGIFDVARFPALRGHLARSVRFPDRSGLGVRERSRGKPSHPSRPRLERLGPRPEDSQRHPARLPCRPRYAGRSRRPPARRAAWRAGRFSKRAILGLQVARSPASLRRPVSLGDSARRRRRWTSRTCRCDPGAVAAVLGHPEGDAADPCRRFGAVRRNVPRLPGASRCEDGARTVARCLRTGARLWSGSRALTGLPVNRFKAALREPAVQMGLWLSLGSAITAEIGATAGFNWLLADGEHGPNDALTITEQLRAVGPYPVSLVARARGGTAASIGPLPDAGVQTIMVPKVESASQAEAIVRQLRYPPSGDRGVAVGSVRASRWRAIDDYLDHAAEELALIIQVETSAGLANLSSLAGVEGVDAF